jgi:hypothetical protein
MSFTKHWHELKNLITAIISALSTSLLIQSRRICIICGLIVGKHFTLQLGVFSDPQVD